MRHLLLGGAIVAISACSAYAQTDAGNANADTSMKLSQAECTSLWNQANPSGGATITEAQAQPYVTNFKAANPDGDGTLDKNEFDKACQDGLVQSAASSGAASGEAGAGNQQETLHPPTNRVGEQVPQMRSDENKPDHSGSKTYNPADNQ